MKTVKRPPQINVRIDERLRAGMKRLAQQMDRSMNYLFALAVKEYLDRNCEAQTASTVRASDLSATTKELTQ